MILLFVVSENQADFNFDMHIRGAVTVNTCIILTIFSTMFDQFLVKQSQVRDIELN